MKKFLIPLAVFAIFSIIATSCKKSCVCYNDTGNLKGKPYSITTKEECNKHAETTDGLYTRCEWE